MDEAAFLKHKVSFIVYGTLHLLLHGSSRKILPTFETAASLPCAGALVLGAKCTSHVTSAAK